VSEVDWPLRTLSSRSSSAATCRRRQVEDEVVLGKVAAAPSHRSYAASRPGRGELGLGHVLTPAGGAGSTLSDLAEVLVRPQALTATLSPTTTSWRSLAETGTNGGFNERSTCCRWLRLARLHPFRFVNQCGRRCSEKIDQGLGRQRLLRGSWRTCDVDQVWALQLSR
jgi:hypothetical protein